MLYPCGVQHFKGIPCAVAQGQHRMPGRQHDMAPPAL